MKSRRWFTRSQWIFLSLVLNAVLVVAGTFLLSRYRNERGEGPDEAYVRLASDNRPAASARNYASPVCEQDSFVFDPNEADSTQLLRLGLAPFQVRSIYNYRAKGGRFSTKDDFRRVYRLTNEQWDRLSPLIRIGRKYRLVDIVDTDPRYRSSAKSPRKPVATVSVDSLQSQEDYASGTAASDATANISSGRYPQKLSGDATVDINLADSALLCRVPGIGPYFSRKIIQYRKRLGGFVHVEQLLQIDDFPADALAWMEVADTSNLIGLDVNRLTVRQLAKHPYMGYYRASEIVDYRRIHGSVPDISVLRGMPHFSDEDVRRLEPYLRF